jgi:hypothetical protein
MPDGYCEPDDVRQALQERNLDGALNDSDFVAPTIESVSGWLRRSSRRHWYDSGGDASDTVPTSPRSASEVRLDVPSSPHAQDRQIRHGESGVRYPVTTDGPYARIRLPHGYVDSLTSLLVRDRDGDVTDWTSAAEITQGRGEDYYLARDGTSEYGLSYLYIRAASIGARVDYGGLLTLTYDYGRDAATEDWSDVRRGVAAAVGAQLTISDDVRTAIPDDGQLVGLDSRRQRLVDDSQQYLEPYLDAPR